MMKMQRPVVLDCICGLGLVEPAETAPSKPNVISMLTDDQGALDANCYGSEDLYYTCHG